MCEELSLEAAWEMGLAIFSFLAGMTTQACMDYYYIRKLEVLALEEANHDAGRRH